MKYISLFDFTNERRYYYALLLIIPQLILFARPYITSDLGVWIAHGQLFLETGSIPTKDIFSILPTTELIYPSWGISIVYAILHNLFGIIGLFLIHRLVFLGFQFLTLWQLRDVEINSKNFYLLLLIMIGAAFYSDRPAMIPILYLGFAWQILHGKQKEIIKLILLTIITILWVNTHGSVLFFMGLVGIWSIYNFLFKGKGVKVFIPVIIISLCTLVNPFTWHIYFYALQTVAISKARQITEWAPPTLWSGPIFETFLFLVLSILITFQIIRRKSWKDFCHPIFFCIIWGPSAVRNILWLFWLAVPSLKELDLFNKGSSQQIKRNSLRPAIVIILLILLLAMMPGLNVGLYKVAKHFKKDISPYNIYSPELMAQEIIDRKLSGNIFHEFEMGSYLILRLAKNHPIKTFIDGRNIIFSQKQLEEYKAIITGAANSQELLKKYKINIILLVKREMGLANMLPVLANWRIIKETSRHILAVRVGSDMR